MKLLLALTLGLLIGAAPASAIEQNCRFLQARAEREACYAKQEAELAAKRKQAAEREAMPPYSPEQMSQEDAALKATMRGICRGC